MSGIAARAGSTKPFFVDVPDPVQPGQGDVLCRTLQLGVCGTDREILQSAQPLAPGDDQFLILGHECLARVEAVGSGVERLQVGDLVVPVVRRPLPPARHRVDMLSFGQFTERGIVHEHGFSTPFWRDRPEYLVRVKPVLSDVAVLTEPVAVAEKAVNEAALVQRARLGDHTWVEQPPRVLITGMGPIGFAALVACRCRDWPVAMYGRDAADSFRAQLATAFGARYLPADQWKQEPDDVEREGFDLVLECTGSDNVMLAAALHLASRGVMVWLGSSRRPEPRPHNVSGMMRVGVLRNHIHLGTVNAAPRDFADALLHLDEMRQTAGEQIQAFITSRIAPDDALWHFQHREPQGIKVVLMYP